MPSNSRTGNSRTVYTTESGRICPDCGKPIAACVCRKKSANEALPKAKSDGVIRVALEKKGRGGKTVSVVTGLAANEETLRALATLMKQRCGTGGTIKDGIIEIQGDHRDLLVTILKEKGYNAKRVGG